MRLPLLLLAPVLLLAACASGPDGSAPAPAPSPAPDLSIDPFSTAFDAPAEHVLEGAVLVPLEPALAQVDFDAFMSSRAHLRTTLQWGGWPGDDGTVEDNARDLARHRKEFDAHEAYAYAVLTPDRSAELACVYINPARNPAEGDAPAAAVAYWVTESALAADFDRVLLNELLRWFEAEWPLRTVTFPTPTANPRGLRLATEAGLTDEGLTRPGEEREGHLMVWRRGS